MDEVEPAGLSPRALRAIALIAVALVGLAVGAGLYLWSTAPHPYQGPPPPPTSLAVPLSMDWRSAGEGWVVVHDAGGPESIVFRTVDGGGHWQRQVSINGPAVVRFTDARHGTLRVDGSRAGAPQVLRTDDGGTHWEPVALPALEPRTVSNVFFLDRAAGWLLTLRPAGAGARTSVYGTADAGQHWLPLLDVVAAEATGPGISTADVLSDLAFVPGGTGWLAGDATAGSPALFVTRNGGGGWTRQALPAGSVGPRPADRLAVAPPVVSADGRGVLPVYDRDGDQGWIYATGDGGATWSDPRPLPWSGGDRRPGFVDGSAGWTSDATDAWVTGDAGRAWRAVAALPGTWQFGAVAPVSATLAWTSAVQAGGRGPLGPARWGLFRTTDAGQHWARMAMPSLS
jgi:photosystem II stability/assembly factor-like uncharacterized protein